MHAASSSFSLVRYGCFNTTTPISNLAQQSKYKYFLNYHQWLNYELWSENMKMFEINFLCELLIGPSESIDMQMGCIELATRKEEKESLMKQDFARQAMMSGICVQWSKIKVEFMSLNLKVVVQIEETQFFVEIQITRLNQNGQGYYFESTSF